MQPAAVTAVKTAQELQEAVLGGAVDIEIHAHLDFRTLPLPRNPILRGLHTQKRPVNTASLYAAAPLRSIRVRRHCSEVVIGGHSAATYRL